MDSGWPFTTDCCLQHNPWPCLWGQGWLHCLSATTYLSGTKTRWYFMSSVSTGQARVRFQNIVQRFRVIRERPDTLRETFAHLFRKRTSYYDFEALKGI